MLHRLLCFAALAPSLAVAEGMSLTSTSFAADAAIPPAYTCEGEDRSPALAWSGAPQGTRSFALIVDDPDAPDPAAPKLTWVHWVLYNLPADRSALAENAAAAGLPAGVEVGLNDWQRPAWGGPCPPIGEHRYFFKLYALDTKLPRGQTLSKQQLLQAIKGHVLGEAQLMGRYRKRGE